MRVIGRQGNKYIATIDEAEICFLMGFDSIYEREWDEARRDIRKQQKSTDRDTNFEGVEIGVVALAEKVKAQRVAQASGKDAIAKIRAMADELERAWPTLIIHKKAEGEVK